MGLLYLIAAVIVSVLFASCYKVATAKNCNLVNVNTTVYLGGTTTMLLIVAFTQHTPVMWQTVLIGALGGIFGFFATGSFFRAMTSRHLSTSWTVISMAVIFPTLTSIFIYHETPNLSKWMGILLMLMALASLAVFPKKSGNPEDLPEDTSREHGITPLMGKICFLIAFVGTGLVSTMHKVFTVNIHGAKDQSMFYALSYYGVAALVAIITRAFKAEKFKPQDIWVGGAMGFFGCVSIFTFVLCLQTLPGIVAFPVRSCSELLLTAGFAFLVFHERPSLGGWIGIFLGAASLVLINL